MSLFENLLIKRKIINFNVLLILLIFATGIFIRLYKLDLQSLWFDETCCAFYSQSEISKIAVSEVIHPPLFNILLHFWGYFFGFTPISMRMLPAILGILSIFIFFYFLSFFFDKDIRILGLLIFCLSPFQIYYSQEVRQYMLFQVLSLSAMYIFMNILKKDTIGLWIILSITLIFNLYTFYFSFILYLSLLLYIVIYKRKLIRKFVILICISLIFYLPWIFFVLSNINFSGKERAYVSHFLFRFFNIFLRFSLGDSGIILNYYNRLDLVGTLKENILILIFYAIVFGTPFIFGFLNSIKLKEKGAFLLTIFCFPLILLSLFFKIFPFMSERYLIYISPLYVIFITIGISTFKNKWKKYLFIILIISLESYSIGNYFFNNNFGKEEWREVAKLIHDDKTYKIIIFHKPDIATPFSFYYRDDTEMYSIPENNIYDLNKNLIDLKKISITDGKPLSDKKIKFRIYNNINEPYPLFWDIFKGYGNIWFVLAKNWDTKFKYKELLDSGLILKQEIVFPKMNGILVYRFNIK